MNQAPWKYIREYECGCIVSRYYGQEFADVKFCKEHCQEVVGKSVIQYVEKKFPRKLPKSTDNQSCDWNKWKGMAHTASECLGIGQ